MSRFDAVFDIAVALSKGLTLNSTVPNLGGEWGVVSCRDALGAFDAKSDAWVGQGDARGFPSREAAEEWARRASGSSYDGMGNEALEIPFVPAVSATVGPIHRAVGPVSFGCIDWSVGPGVEIETGDDSAFGAAVAFIALVGHEAAIESLEAR